MTRYDVFGPYRLDSDRMKVTSEHLQAFWDERETDAEEGLCAAVGIYIISVLARSDADHRPWYVGKTGKAGFQRRLKQHELTFRRVLEHVDRGSLHITFVALRSPSGTRFRKISSVDISHNDWLESALIGNALLKNPELLNASKTKRLKTLVVPGYINSRGKLTKSASLLKKMLQSS